MTKIAELPYRAAIALHGADRVTFLNGLVSNDVSLASPGRAVWAALLTAQGKWLADFFILSDGDRLLLDCEEAQADMLMTRLGRYRLRADVALERTDLRVFAAWDGAPEPGGGVAAPDPRLPEAGWRILVGNQATNETAAAWDAHRIPLGLPDGSRDMEAEKTVLLEAGFDELGGISWTKGCYMGQELTARTRYRGLVKRRLVPVSGTAPLPQPGTPILAEDRDVGTMRSSNGNAGLALLRNEAIGKPLTAEGHPLSVCKPDWMQQPDGAGLHPAPHQISV